MFSGMPERGRRQLVAMRPVSGDHLSPRRALRTVDDRTPRPRPQPKQVPPSVPETAPNRVLSYSTAAPAMLQRALVDAARRFSPPRVTSRSSLSFRRALAYVIGFLLLIRGRRSGDWVGDCNGQHCFTRTHRASARHRGCARGSRAKGRIVYGRTSPAGPGSPKPRQLRSADSDAHFKRWQLRMGAGWLNGVHG